MKIIYSNNFIFMYFIPVMMLENGGYLLIQTIRVNLNGD